jgi:site-specific DNA-methyltransferase (adenine-specific)
MTKELLGSLELNRIYQRDCLSDGGMALIPDKSIDMILCDLPYGTTACKWDTIIPFDKLWAQYERVIKDNGAIVLTASQPFTSQLVASNLNIFRYEWIWQKSKANGFPMANHRPLKKHENVLVFSKSPATTLKNGEAMTYFPQDLVEVEKEKTSKTKRNGTTLSGGRFKNETYTQKYTNYPTSVLQVPNESKTEHPTQKPVSLFEYLIKTYTNEGNIVLDNCMGSGTTAVAALNTNRKFIGFETEPAYIEIANKRIDDLR